MVSLMFVISSSLNIVYFVCTLYKRMCYVTATQYFLFYTVFTLEKPEQTGLISRVFLGYVSNGTRNITKLAPAAC